MERNFGSPLRRVIFVSMFSATLPVAWLLFVAGPGVVGVLPIVIAIGLSISAGFHDWAWPVPDCPHCGAYTEWAPRVARDAVDVAPVVRVAARRPKLAA